MENISNKKIEYIRKVDKSQIPTCNIMGVNIAAINMEWLLQYLEKNIDDLHGDYICVSNVHTTVTSYEDSEYCAIQNGGLMAIPDGGPLSTVGQKRGFVDMRRTTGPSLMGEIFKISAKKGYRHFFYGSTEETLELLGKKLNENYTGIQIVGMYSPPFRPLTEEENQEIIKILFQEAKCAQARREKWTKETGGGFTVFAALGKERDERTHCRFMYELLNPKGIHHQGDIFLRKFYKFYPCHLENVCSLKIYYTIFL